MTFGPFANRPWTLVLCGAAGSETREVSWTGDRPPIILETTKPLSAALDEFDQFEEGKQTDFAKELVERWRLSYVSRSDKRAWYDHTIAGVER